MWGYVVHTKQELIISGLVWTAEPHTKQDKHNMELNTATKSM